MDGLRLSSTILALCFLASCSGGRFATESQDSGSPKLQQEQQDQLDSLEKFNRVEVPAVQWPRAKKNENSRVVRASKKTNLKNIQSTISGDRAELTAELELDGKNLGVQTFIGTFSDREVVLEPAAVELQGKLKAKIICTSLEEHLCDDYFIDMFYLQNEKIYVDQYVMNALPNDRPKPTTPISPTTPANPDSEIKTPKTEIPNYDNYDVQEQFFDEEEGSQPGSYVGTSEKEILSLFDAKPSVAPAPPAQDPQPSSPVENNGGKPAPVKPEPGVKPLPTGPIKPPATPPKPVERPPVVVTTTTTSTTTTLKTPVRPTTPTTPAPVIPTVPGLQSPILPMGSSVPTDQAIRMPHRGQLSRPTDFLEMTRQFDVPFKIFRPERKRYYGTFDLAELIVEVGNYIKTLIPNHKILMGDISAEKGGKIGSHSSHQNGLDVDLPYLVRDEALQFANIVNGEKLNKSFMLEEQWKVFRHIFQSGMIELVFVDPVIKKALCYQAQQSGDLKDRTDRGLGYEILRRVRNWRGHNNHYHVRIRCSENNPRCNQDVYTLADSGCF